MLAFEFTGVSGKMTFPDLLTSGMVGREVRIELSDDWDGLYKTAVFSNGETTRAVPLTEVVVEIPWEVLVSPFKKLMVGICGTDADGKLVIPTIMAEGPTISMGADPHAMEGTEPEVPLGKLTLEDADVQMFVTEDSEGNFSSEIGLQTVAGAQIGRALVNAGTMVTLRASGERFGNAEAADVMEGKTFTSASGLMVTGTRKPVRVVNGITNVTAIDTGLEVISGMVLYRGDVKTEGLVHAVYDGDTVHCVCSFGEGICGVDSGNYGLADGGVFTWRGAGIAGLATDAVYHFIAWYEG